MGDGYDYLYDHLANLGQELSTSVLQGGAGFCGVVVEDFAGGEMTAASALDVILLYDHEAGAEGSDGAKSLAPSQYFARLTQRLVAALSAPTAEGTLYEVDFRLRPSGNSGPLASSVLWTSIGLKLPCWPRAVEVVPISVPRKPWITASASEA